MSEVVRLYRYKSLLCQRKAVSAAELMSVLEVSRATVKRDIAKLRDQLHVPIIFNRELGGYQLEPDQAECELPGLWFSQEEILSLVTIQHLLEQLEPGLLGAKLQPLQKRLAQLMDKHGLASQDVARRIRIVHAGKRQVVTKSFRAGGCGHVGGQTPEDLALQPAKRHHHRARGVTAAAGALPRQLVSGCLVPSARRCAQLQH
jgi:predicted DNA-binding transcriptional regulator YafY